MKNRDLLFCFALMHCLSWELLCEPNFLCISVLSIVSGPRVQLATCISALNHPLVYSTDRSEAVVPVLVLLFFALWFILRGDFFYVLPCVILLLCFFSPFSIAITSLGEERANLKIVKVL